MIIGTASKNRPLFLAVNNNPVERITCLTLPGINISNNLRWDVHVDVLCVKVESRLYFLYCLNVMDCQLMIFLGIWIGGLTSPFHTCSKWLILGCVETCCRHNSSPSHLTIHNCFWISQTGLTQTLSNGGWWDILKLHFSTW